MTGLVPGRGIASITVDHADACISKMIFIDHTLCHSTIAIRGSRSVASECRGRSLESGSRIVQSEYLGAGMSESKPSWRQRGDTV